MFQTTPITWLQEFSTPALTIFMQALSYIGYPTFYIVFILILFFCIDYKKGWEILHLTLFGALLTFLLKDFFSYPRPFYLDGSAQLLDPFLLKSKFPLIQGFEQQSFFALIPENILDEFRKLKDPKYGFPSGHTSLSLCFWGFLYISYKDNRIIKLLSLFMIIGVPFSRVYLGVHFIGDIIGGYILGLVTLFIFKQKIVKCIFLFRPPLLNFSMIYLFLFPFATLFILSTTDIFISCYFLGINTLLFTMKDFNVIEKLESGPYRNRIILFFSVLILFFSIRLLLKNILIIIDLNENILATIIRHILTPFLGISIPIFTFKKLIKIK